jgi:hypothetical protein
VREKAAACLLLHPDTPHTHHTLHTHHRLLHPDTLLPMAEGVASPQRERVREAVASPRHHHLEHVSNQVSTQQHLQHVSTRYY